MAMRRQFFLRYLLPSILLATTLTIYRRQNDFTVFRLQSGDKLQESDTKEKESSSLRTTTKGNNSIPSTNSRTDYPHRYVDTIKRDNEVVQKGVATDVRRYRKACWEKQWALEILHSSDGHVSVDERVCQKLPTPQQVNRLYGSDPIVYGMETCEQFRHNVQQVQLETQNRTSSVPTVRVAGLYNTGTNAMAVSLARNLQQDLRFWKPSVLHKFREHMDRLYNVPWEKHVPARYRTSFVVPQDEGVDLRLVLPVVLIRDPYWWFQSMCKQSYKVQWKKRGEHRCPNMVNQAGVNGVQVSYEDRYSQQYDSLVGLWNEWNREYLDADFPRLMIRFEDQFFHAEKVMELISQCSGIPQDLPYLYLWSKSKNHGDSNNFLTAMEIYGTGKGRRTPISTLDLEYAENTLDPELMEIFGYRHTGR